MAEVRSTYIEPRQLARGHPDEHVVEALEAHIATLMEAIARAEALGEQRRQEAQVVDLDGNQLAFGMGSSSPT
jgi:hypothetical protein